MGCLVGENEGIHRLTKEMSPLLSSCGIFLICKHQCRVVHSGVWPRKRSQPLGAGLWWGRGETVGATALLIASVPSPAGGRGWTEKIFASSLSRPPAANCPWLVSYCQPICHFGDGEQGDQGQE
jgi:hypothetical protein